MPNSRPADEEPKWRAWRVSSTAASTSSSSHHHHHHHHRQHSHQRRQTAVVSGFSFASAATFCAPLTQSHRIDVRQTVPKSNLYKSTYWLHPNMAITREANGQEEFVGELVPLQATKSNIIVNYFASLEENTSLRFSHTAHTPPACKPKQPSDDYLEKNMSKLVEQLELLVMKPSAQQTPSSKSL
ncbi:unnamed protein product [Caenorhabditis bovis]|uniref:Uncharacterized protein n=1 Tax=Caenorhabditis bovis TaxID=2654633 RepID=A0A8S1EZJ6_9PELO|nr:unnamed protein product [Caenorhabditis bovis]